MLTYFLKGGIIMWPLLICSIISVTIIIERLIYFRSIKINHTIVSKIMELISQKDFEKAKKLNERLSSPLRKILLTGIENFFSVNIETKLQDVADQEIPKLERYLPILAAIASVSTLLGFTGTVLGMIKAFESIAQAGYASPQVVAKGIAEALITTAAGLIVAIPTVIFYHYFNYRVNRYIHLLEHYIQEFLSLKK